MAAWLALWLALWLTARTFATIRAKVFSRFVPGKNIVASTVSRAPGPARFMESQQGHFQGGDRRRSTALPLITSSRSSGPSTTQPALRSEVGVTPDLWMQALAICDCRTMRRRSRSLQVEGWVSCL